MAEFFNTGIDTDYLTIVLVTLTLIIAIVLPLSIYQLQKIRPKIKIDRYNSNNYHVENVTIIVYVKNIGHILAEEVKYEMTSMTKEVTVSQNSKLSTDLPSGGSWAPSATVSIKKGEECKIKFEVSWDNHTFKLKKRNKLTQEFSCNRIEDQNVRFENC